MRAREKYRIDFELGGTSLKTDRALEHALDIRKFEIGLYWQRATYFWTLIAASFAGFFAVLAADDMPDAAFYAFVLACIGFIFSLAWFLANRGSKFWQENWENHVDMLEDSVVGPLYKTVLHRPRPEKLRHRILTLIEGPGPVSVSKMNQWVSLFTLLIWVPLAISVLPEFDSGADVSAKHAAVSFITVVTIFLMILRTESSLGKQHDYAMSVRPADIVS